MHETNNYRVDKKPTRGNKKTNNNETSVIFVRCDRRKLIKWTNSPVYRYYINNFHENTGKKSVCVRAF